jgi:hypothetical protein
MSGVWLRPEIVVIDEDDVSVRVLDVSAEILLVGMYVCKGRP